jgi:hypothetical protein
LRKWYY